MLVPSTSNPCVAVGDGSLSIGANFGFRICHRVACTDSGCSGALSPHNVMLVSFVVATGDSTTPSESV